MYFSQKFLEFKQMQAIILAAGLGDDLRNIPKIMRNAWLR